MKSKKLIADHERMAAELKEMLAKKEAEEAGHNKIPDDVRDIPTTYPIHAYSKTSDGKEIFGFHVNAVGAIIKDWHNITYDTTDTTWTGKRNSCITYDVRDEQYTVDTSSCFDDNSIYFSTQAIAEKCAE